MLKYNNMDEQTRDFQKVEAGLITETNDRDGTVTVKNPLNNGTLKTLHLFYSGWKEAIPGKTVIDYQPYTNGYRQSYRVLGVTPDGIAATIRAKVQAAQ